MNLATGIIGLPNVGKSTLFNAITNSKVEAANYPFATIEPNVGIVTLPDRRINDLANLIHPEKTVPSLVKFIDIAGLVKGASKGEGLGNKFLENIRDVNAICHVVRCFEDINITHVNTRIDPIRDIDIVNLELILSDLEIVTKRIGRIQKSALAGNIEHQAEFNCLKKIAKILKDCRLIKPDELTEKEMLIISGFNLISMKPVFFVANIAEDEIQDPTLNKHYVNLKQYLDTLNYQVIPISAKIEQEISELTNKEDKKMFLEELKLTDSGLNLMIKKSFKLLNLSTYFTFGKIEVRSWIFTNGMKAPECAGIIHSDFERGFIKAEIVSFIDLLTYKSELKAKEFGKLRLEGKNYLMQDGDVCHFKFNV